MNKSLILAKLYLSKIRLVTILPMAYKLSMRQSLIKQLANVRAQAQLIEDELIALDKSHPIIYELEDMIAKARESHITLLQNKSADYGTIIALENRIMKFELLLNKKKKEFGYAHKAI